MKIRIKNIKMIITRTRKTDDIERTEKRIAASEFPEKGLAPPAPEENHRTGVFTRDDGRS